MSASLIRRYLNAQVAKDLEQKMVFVGGARQVGKTTLARQLLGPDGAGYLNWDVPDHRTRILERQLPAAPLLVFDEIHKYRSWRGYMKGLYDADPSRRLLVTGSARLDYYRRGGDSLQGRYHYLRLHPLSYAEINDAGRGALSDLLELGGFPEPLLSGSATAAQRWRREYRSRLVREDLATLESVSDLGNIELLSLRLPALVGSPLSVNALREDLQVAHKTAAKWLTMLERLYLVFRLPPFGAPTIRAVKKARKLYMLDWGYVKDPGARFENLVACHLLKWVHFQQDAFGRDLELRYFRDIDGREVDFVMTEEGRPIHLIEAKLAASRVDPALRYLKRRFDCEAWQVSATGDRDFETPEGIRVAPAEVLLATLV